MNAYLNDWIIGWTGRLLSSNCRWSHREVKERKGKGKGKKRKLEGKEKEKKRKRKGKERKGKEEEGKEYCEIVQDRKRKEH